MDPVQRITMSVGLTLLGCALAGCTQYGYMIVEPAELAQTIDVRQTEIERPPVMYHLAEVDRRLRLRVVNETDDPIRIVGGESYLVDPAGESHALRSQTVAPHSFVSFTLPPRRPRYGSGLGFGLGVGGGSSGGFGGVGVGSHWDDDDDFYTAPDEPPYWNWGEGDVRLHLVMARGEERVEHEFLLRRQKEE